MLDYEFHVARRFARPIVRGDYSTLSEEDRERAEEFAATVQRMLGPGHWEWDRYPDYAKSQGECEITGEYGDIEIITFMKED